MKLAFKGLIVAAVAIAGSSALHVMSARAQAGGQQGPEQTPPMAEDVFTNVQILRGIPVDEFMDTMGFFSAATGLNCQDCHVGESGGDWAKYADETGRKATTRRMMAMVTALNRANFGGRRVVSCWSCHRGINVPEVVPDLAVMGHELDAGGKKDDGAAGVGKFPRRGDSPTAGGPIGLEHQVNLRRCASLWPIPGRDAKSIGDVIAELISTFHAPTFGIQKDAYHYEVDYRSSSGDFAIIRVKPKTPP